MAGIKTPMKPHDAHIGDDDSDVLMDQEDAERGPAQAEVDQLDQDIEGAMPTHLKLASCHRTMEAEKKGLDRAVTARDAARERAEQASENLRSKEELLVQARASHEKAADAIAALEKPQLQEVEAQTVTLAHVEKMINLFSQWVPPSRAPIFPAAWKRHGRAQCKLRPERDMPPPPLATSCRGGERGQWQKEEPEGTGSQCGSAAC